MSLKLGSFGTVGGGSRWLFVRGLVREKIHWFKFPEVFQAVLPDVQIEYLDLPGNGEHHRLTTPLTMDEFVDHMKERAGPPPYQILAMSLGAMCTLRWIERAPQQFERAVLINTSAAGVSPFWERLTLSAQPKIFALLQDAVFSSNNLRMREKAILELTTRLFAKNSAPYEEAIREFEGAARERPVLVTNFLRQLWVAARFRPRLSPVQVPLLWLSGEKDQLVNPRAGQKLAGLLGGALKIHPEAGHDLPLDDPQWVAKSVAEWVIS